MNASNERVAIVSGAGVSSYRATAKKLAAAGFTVVGVDRSEEGLKELPDSIRRDAADPAAARSVVDRIATEDCPSRRKPGRPTWPARSGRIFDHVDPGRVANAAQALSKIAAQLEASR